MWEDATNVNGGKWVVPLPKNRKDILDEYWLQSVLPTRDPCLSLLWMPVFESKDFLILKFSPWHLTGLSSSGLQQLGSNLEGTHSNWGELR